MRIAEITMFILVILLTISVGFNVFNYTAKSPEPISEIVSVSDTIVRIDTVFHTVTQQVTIEKPVPVYIDTTSNIRTYRDTVYLPYGTIKGEQVVLGELLRKDFQVDFEIPEVYRTLEVNNRISYSDRRHSLFTSFGIRTSFEGACSLIFGVTYEPENQRCLIGLEYGFDGQISCRISLPIH